jgi:hypothetical protein
MDFLKSTNVMITLNNYKSLIQSVKGSIGSSSKEQLKEMLSEVDDALSEVSFEMDNLGYPNLKTEEVDVISELSSIQAELLTKLDLPL